MSPTRTFRFIRLAIPLLLMCSVPSAGLAQSPKHGFSGDAYGSYAFVDSEQGFVRVGKSAESSLGCLTDTGFHSSNTILTVSVPSLFSSGQVNSTADSLQLTSGVASRTVADVHTLTVLNGVIQATEVRAVSTSTQSLGGFSVSSDGSALLGLQVLGLPLTSPAANTRIDLPGIGYVVLNEQIAEVTGNSASLTVNMIHVVVNQNNAVGIPWGTNILIGHADSGTLYLAGTLAGFAYGTQVDGSVVRMGASALNLMPCLGTGGQIRVTNVGSVSMQNVFTTQSVATTAQGSVSPVSATSDMTAEIQGLNILGGLITADSLQAQAHASANGASPSLSDAGSMFLNLSVAGHPEVTVNASPNTQVPLTNLGTLWIRRVIQSNNQIEVRMIELIIEVPNSYNLPVGTDIQVAVAAAATL